MLILEIILMQEFKMKHIYRFNVNNKVNKFRLGTIKLMSI